MPGTQLGLCKCGTKNILGTDPCYALNCFGIAEDAVSDRYPIQQLPIWKNLLEHAWRSSPHILWQGSQNRERANLTQNNCPSSRESREWVSPELGVGTDCSGWRVELRLTDRGSPGTGAWNEG